LNDIAVANSGLLREYSLLDVRVRMLMLSVKSWIKWKDIGNAAERTLSSYTWMIMVIFCLQCIGFVPNLQCQEFMKKHGAVYSGAGDQNRMHNINGLKTIYLHHDVVLAKGIWTQPKHLESTPISALLLGFFVFYASFFSQETTAVSIRLGNMSMQKTVFSKSSNLWRMVIEDPFETYDCHIPHDLGTPMDEKGQNKVTKALQEAANTMEEMFGSCHEKIVDCIGSFNIVEKSSSSASSYTTKDMILEHHKQEEVHQQQIQSKITMGGTSTVIGSITSRDKEKQTIHENVHNETSTKSNDNNVREHDGDDKKPYIHANLDGRMRLNALQKNGNGNGIAKKAPGHRQGTKKSQHSNNKGYSRSKDTTPYISNRKNTSRS
jgi:DNA polymerase sigma